MSITKEEAEILLRLMEEVDWVGGPSEFIGANPQEEASYDSVQLKLERIAGYVLR